MKKLITLILAVFMLVSLIAGSAFSVSAEDEALTAKLYDVEADEGWLYVVFNKPVADPTSTDGVKIALVGHGWPLDGTGELRYLLRCEFAAVEVVTDRIWRFSNVSSRTDAAKKEFKSWFMTNCMTAETDIAKVDNWSVRLWGNITTADGSEYLELDEDTIVLDMNGVFEEEPSVCIEDDVTNPEKAATIYDLGVNIDTDTQGTTTADDTTTAADTTTASDTTAASDTTTAEATTGTAASTTEAPEDDESSPIVWIIVAVAAVVVVGVVAVIIVNKKKKA